MPNDKISTYACYKRHKSCFPEDYDSFIFVPKAHTKHRMQRSKKFQQFYAAFDLDPVSRRHLRRVGKNFLNNSVQNLQKKTGASLDTKFSGRTARRTASSKMSQYRVALAEHTSGMRHMSAKTTLGYSDSTENTKNQRRLAMVDQDFCSALSSDEEDKKSAAKPDFVEASIFCFRVCRTENSPSNLILTYLRRRAPLLGVRRMCKTALQQLCRQAHYLCNRFLLGGDHDASPIPARNDATTFFSCSWTTCPHLHLPANAHEWIHGW